MVVTSLVLSVVSSLSPVAASLPFYISEAARLYQRASQLASHIPWDIPLHIIGNISHRVMAGAASTASGAEEVIMVGERLQHSLHHHSRHLLSNSSRHISLHLHSKENSQQWCQPSRSRGTSKPISSRDIIEQHIGIYDNTAPSTDIRNIYRSFSEVYIDGHHLSFNNIDDLDLWDLTSLHRAATPEFHLGHVHLIHNIAHGADINQTFYIVLSNI